MVKVYEQKPSREATVEDDKPSSKQKAKRKAIAINKAKAKAQKKTEKENADKPRDCEVCKWKYTKHRGKKCPGDVQVCDDFEWRHAKTKKKNKSVEIDEDALVPVTETQVVSSMQSAAPITRTILDMGFRVAAMPERTQESIDPAAPTRVILRHSLHIALSALTQAEQCYYSDPDDEENYKKIVKLIETVQNLIKDIRASDDPQELYEDLKKSVIEPMVTNIIQTLASEINSARSQFGRLVPETKYDIMNEIITTTLKNIAIGSDQIYKNYLDELRDVLGCEGDGR